MAKQLHTKESLLIALDLCLAHFQDLLIIYLKFTANSAQNIRKKLNHYVILQDLKIINYIINTTYLKKDG